MNDEQKDNIDYLYDDINEENGEKVTLRNMHTITGKGVSTDKIKIIKNPPQEIFQKFYGKYQELAEKNPNMEKYYSGYEEDLLSKFVEYEKQKNNSKSEKEETTSQNKNIFSKSNIYKIAKDPEVALEDENSGNVIDEIEKTHEEKEIGGIIK